MSKKKKILLSVLVVLVIGSIWATKVVKRMLRGGDLEDIAVYVPADAAVFVANRGAGEQIFEFFYQQLIILLHLFLLTVCLQFLFLEENMQNGKVYIS